MAFSVNDGSDESHSVEGYHNSWKAIGAPAQSGLSRACCAMTAAIVPPAESPATAIRVRRCCPGAELRRVLGDPQRCGPSVFDGGGVGVLGRQPVVDGHHDRVGADGMLAAGAVVRVEVAHHEAAAVEKHHHGRPELSALPSESVGGQ